MPAVSRDIRILTYAYQPIGVNTYEYITRQRQELHTMSPHIIYLQATYYPSIDMLCFLYLAHLSSSGAVLVHIVGEWVSVDAWSLTHTRTHTYTRTHTHTHITCCVAHTHPHVAPTPAPSRCPFGGGSASIFGRRSHTYTQY